MYRITEGIASGLEYLHASIIHGALKCKNVFVSLDFKTSNIFKVKISDFGLNEFQADNAPLKHWPTVKYRSSHSMASLSNKEISSLKASKMDDMYAFGLIFRSMLSGKEPFTEITEWDAIERLKKNDIEPLPDNCNFLEAHFINACMNSESEFTATKAIKACKDLLSRPEKFTLLKTALHTFDESLPPLDTLVRASIYEFFMKLHFQ